MKRSPELPALQFDLQSQAFKENPFPTLAQIGAGTGGACAVPAFRQSLDGHHLRRGQRAAPRSRAFVQNPITAGNRWMGAILRWLPRSLKPHRPSLVFPRRWRDWL